jgi:hypothetical protein
MAIQDLPQFASLSEEAKKIVLSKYGSLSPEAKTIVDSKINSSIQGPAGQPIQGEVMRDVPAASGMVEEVPGPITNALMMGVGGGASPLEGVATIVSKALPTAKEAIGKGLARAGEVAFAPFKSTSEAAINAAEQGAGVVLRSPVTKQMAQELGLQKALNTLQKSQTQLNQL